jgi:hypothetical protein
MNVEKRIQLVEKQLNEKGTKKSSFLERQGVYNDLDEVYTDQLKHENLAGFGGRNNQTYKPRLKQASVNYSF